MAREPAELDDCRGRRQDRPAQPLLRAGDPYEVEAAYCREDESQARVAAEVSSTVMASWQLTPPVMAELLMQRVMRFSRMEPRGLRVLDTTKGPHGLAHPPRPPVAEDPGPVRALVAQMRNAGWNDPIMIPGVLEGTATVVVPSLLLNAGQLPVTATGQRQISPSTVILALLGLVIGGETAEPNAATDAGR